MTDDTFGISEEESRFAQRRENAWEILDKLDCPESIKTPGREWTEYPDVEEMVDDEVIPREPEMEASGNAEVLTGEEAMKAAGDKLLQQVTASENKITALHTALMNSLVYIKAEGQASIEISFTEEDPLFASLVVETDQNAEVNVTQKFEGDAKLSSTTVELYADKNSTIKYRELEDTEAEVFHSINCSKVERDANAKLAASSFGAQKLRSSNRTKLEGENSRVEDKGFFFLSNEQHHDMSKKVEHIAEETGCRMETCGAVKDSSRSVYEGVQDVGKEASGTSSFQHEETLMLSEDAEADASPKLMIENSDVEATHAAATGTPSTQKLHYMESRGLSEKKAEKLVVKGFYQPLLDKIDSEKFREELKQRINRKLED